jgi:hypothetical protein
MPMTGVGGAVPDELLRSTGSSTTWFETYTTTTNETGVYIGEKQQVDFRLIVNAIGVTSGTTTDYSATVKFQDSASAGTGYTDMGIAFDAINATSGDSFAATGQAVEFQHRVVRTRTGRPHVRPVITMGGTNPTVTLALVPQPAGLAS